MRVRDSMDREIGVVFAFQGAIFFGIVSRLVSAPLADQGVVLVGLWILVGAFLFTFAAMMTRFFWTAPPPEVLSKAFQDRGERAWAMFVPNIVEAHRKNDRMLKWKARWLKWAVAVALADVILITVSVTLRYLGGG